jgi:hypothetical protein
MKTVRSDVLMTGKMYLDVGRRAEGRWDMLRKVLDESRC